MMARKLNTRRGSIGFLAISAAAVATVSAADVTSTWIDQASGTGNWNVAANWSNVPAVSQFPHNGNGGFTYDAIVASPTANIITLGQDIDLQNFTLNGATITGPNALTIHNQMTWNSGALRNSATTISGGATFELDTPTRVTLTGTFDNFGTTTWTRGGMTGDTFAALGVFHNHAGATFLANTSFRGQGAFGIGSFINAGTLIKNAGTEARWGGVTAISNTGTIMVQTGVVRFVSSVAQVASGVLSDGTWVVDSTATGTATLHFDQATPVTTISPDARVEIIGANASFVLLDTLTTNDGFFRIAGGHHFAALSGFTNSGTTVIDSGTALKITATLQNTGTIDVNGGGMVLDYTGATPIATIINHISHARNGGAWNQDGITSTAARVASPRNTMLGVLEGSDYLALYGPGAMYFGSPVDETSVLVKYTYYGDTDFNGVVNFDDYARTDSGFNNNRSGWLNGDFDLNGVVNFDDYALIDLAFNTQSGALRAGQPVPEPTSLALLSCAMVSCAAARRRRRQIS